MHAENLVVDEGCNGKAVEAISEDLPKLDSMTALAFVVEAIYSVN